MRIKHNKLRNTGLIFEILTRQVTADILEGKNSPAIFILKKYFSGNSYLLKEYKLYKLLSTNRTLSNQKAEAILGTITEVVRKLDRPILKKLKYNIVSEIKRHYNLEEFFAIQIPNYKPYAALYCLLESYSDTKLVDPSFIIENRTTVVQHLTNKKPTEKEVKDSLIEEYSKYDKDLRLLTFKILLEKFNKRYKDFLPEQKEILRQFINSASSTVRLRTFVNEQIEITKSEIKKNSGKVKDEIIKIKINEVLNTLKLLSPKDRVKDSHLAALMQYYDLIEELKSL